MRLYEPIPGDELLDLMDEVFDECKQLAQSKGEDYVGQNIEEDHLENVGEAAGWVGAVIRAADKFRRLKTAYQTGSLNHESIENSFVDAINYLVYGLIMYRRRNFDVEISLKPIREDSIYRYYADGITGKNPLIEGLDRPSDNPEVWSPCKHERTYIEKLNDTADRAVRICRDCGARIYR